MDTNKSVAILLAFIMLCAGNVSCTAMAQPQPEPESESQDHEILNMRAASCLLKIASDPTVMPISDKILDRLVNSSGVLDKAAREVGGITPEDILDVFVKQLSTTADGFAYVFHLQYDGNKQTEELMAAVIDNLSLALYNDYEQSLQQMRDRLRLATVEANRAEEELVFFQKELRELAGSRGSLLRQAIVEEIDEHHEGIQLYKLRLEAKRADIEALQKQIAETPQKVKEQLGNDPIVRELKGMIERRAAQLERVKLQKQSGRTLESDLVDLEEKLAKLRIELAQRSDKVSESAGGLAMEGLIGELEHDSEEMSEAEIYLKDSQERLTEAVSLLEKADRFEILAIKTERARENFKEAIKRQDELRREIRMIQPPMVSVLGAD